MDELGRVVIEEIRGRLVSGFPQQARACLDALSDDQIWWRPNSASNSVGNLVLHLCGSTRHFLGRAVGGTDYRRDRPAEFAEKGPIPRERLRAILDETVAETDRVLSSLGPERLGEVTDRARRALHRAQPAAAHVPPLGRPRGTDGLRGQGPPGGRLRRALEEDDGHAGPVTAAGATGQA